MIAINLGFLGLGIYLRFGSPGLALSGLFLLYCMVKVALEGIGKAILTRLLGRLFAGKKRANRDIVWRTDELASKARGERMDGLSTTD